MKPRASSSLKANEKKATVPATRIEALATRLYSSLPWPKKRTS